MCTLYCVTPILPTVMLITEFDADSKLFASSKSELHSLHHMLSLRSCSSQMTLRPRGHSYDVSRVVYDLTKHSFILRSLHKQKAVSL